MQKEVIEKKIKRLDLHVGKEVNYATNKGSENNK